MSEIRDLLQQRLETDEWSIGQLLVRPGIFVCHVDDATRLDMEVFKLSTDARELAKYDDAGAYRPLKTAPNLRHGWLLELADVDELRQALDFFYPSAIGTWATCLRGELTGLPLRDTLNRQSGMYRVTQLITDEQADEVIQKTCVEGCLRRRLWTVNSVLPNPQSEIPNSDILCVEACNLLVAACRPVAKKNTAPLV